MLDDQLALVLEDFQGDSLHNYLAQAGRLDLPQFLRGQPLKLAKGWAIFISTM